MRPLAILLILSFLALSCKSTMHTGNKHKGVQIAFEQGGKIIKPSKGGVKLKKEAFNVILDVPIAMGVLISASHNDSILKLCSAEKLPNVFENNNVVAVDLFNQERTIYVSDDSVNAYYYASEDEHTFNKVTLSNLAYRATRKVSSFSNVDTSTTTEIEKMRKPVYLVFAGVNLANEEPGTPFLLNQHFKIVWKK